MKHIILTLSFIFFITPAVAQSPLLDEMARKNFEQEMEEVERHEEAPEAPEEPQPLPPAEEVGELPEPVETVEIDEPPLRVKEDIVQDDEADALEERMRDLYEDLAEQARRADEVALENDMPADREETLMLSQEAFEQYALSECARLAAYTKRDKQKAEMNCKKRFYIQRIKALETIR